MTEPFSEFVRNGRKESQRASIVMKKESGDSGFCLRAKGGKKAIDELVRTLNEAL
jgi:hypothetical protein